MKQLYATCILSVLLIGKIHSSFGNQHLPEARTTRYALGCGFCL